MKTKFFLAAGLLVTAFGYCQSNSYVEQTPTTLDGKHNVIIGDSAGQSNTGASNTFIGTRAGKNTAAGGNNVYLGRQAGESNNLSNNVFVGTYAGENINGAKNVIIGDQAGRYAQNGTDNVFVGPQAGNSASGDNNIFIGKQAGSTISGDYNICIGRNAGIYNLNQNNILYIHNSNSPAPNPLIYGEFDNRNIKFNAKRVGIGYEGTSNPEFGDFYDTFDTSTLKYRLFVRGGILAEEVRIRSYVNWPDYVFADNYKLMPLSEIEQYIADNKHLPNMPSAEEVEKEGLAVGNIVKLQQEKIEELTLHLIKQEREIEQLKAKNKEIDELKAQVQLLLNKQ